MKKPSVFVNKIEHKLNNNENVFSTFKREKNESRNSNIDVRKKLKEIFSSPKYVYKANTIIETKDGIQEKEIVGINNNEILTIDNEKIKIDDILDINLKN